MNIYQFMSDSHWLTFFLAVLLFELIMVLVKYPLRHWNIRKHGWPPAHIDADGDLKDN